MTLLLASDLDRTLIYSADAMAMGEPVADPVRVEVYDGRDISFVSPRALKQLAELAAEVPFVPVTTRTVAQYERIHLPGVRIRHAITTNGAAMLVDGRVCRDWTEEVERLLAGVSPYDEAAALLAPVVDRPWVHKVRSAEDRFVYTVFDPATADPAWFDELRAVGDELGWVVSVQGRKAYVIPSSLTKEAALAEVARREGVARTAAAGDSLLDRGLLEHVDHPVRPAHGELHDQGWTLPGLHVTTRSGGGAAEEIVEQFAALRGWSTD